MSDTLIPSEDLARERLKRAYATNVVRLPGAEVGWGDETGVRP
jgi:hypothetical protein